MREKRRTAWWGADDRGKGSVTKDIGVAVVGLGWMGQVRSRGYWRFPTTTPIVRSGRGL